MGGKSVSSKHMNTLKIFLPKLVRGQELATQPSSSHKSTVCSPTLMNF